MNIVWGGIPLISILAAQFTLSIGLRKTNTMELSMSAVNSTVKVFEEFQINVKLKISALWIAVMFCYVYGDYIEIYVPGVIADAMTVNSSIDIQLEFFAVAILMVMPSVMIFFTLVVKPNVNRWLNIILAAFYIVLLIAVNTETGWWFYLFLTAIELLISMGIIWYAWKWPALEA